MKQERFENVKTFHVATLTEVENNKNIVVLFTELRISRESIPEGWVTYELRHNDSNGDLATIEPFVFVNFAGTIIAHEELNLHETNKSLKDIYATFRKVTGASRNNDYGDYDMSIGDKSLCYSDTNDLLLKIDELNKNEVLK